VALTVLVVDDSAVVRSMLIRTLRQSALPVTAVQQAESAAQALRILGRTDVDVAVIDLHVGGTQCVALLDLPADAALSRVGVVMVILDDALPGSAAEAAARGATPLRAPFTPRRPDYCLERWSS